MKVTFGPYILPTQRCLEPTSNIIQLTCTVPSRSLVQSDDMPITLYVIVSSDQPHNVLDAWQIGYFSYQRRKRYSSEPPLDYDMMMKRTKPSDSSSANDVTVHVASPSQQTTSANFMPSSQQNNDFEYYGLSQHYDPSPVPYYNEPTLSPQLMLPSKPTTPTHPHTYDTSTSTNVPASVVSISTVDDFQNEYTDPSLTFGISISTSLQHPPIFSPSPSGLLTILPNTIETTNVTAQTPSIISYDPFANLLSHGELIIEGDTNTMTQNWTDAEIQDSRRLVRFWRRQQDHQIICRFQAIPPTFRANLPPEIIVSCIFWHDKQDYFITSVDVIYLLETLIGIRFTSEEKNRVRRNLEGLHPLTVSKIKPDSADFFKLIMALNPPRPRNIEKDLKVFAWSSLPSALKKIISKYSASYSSTASVILDTFAM